MKQAASTAWGGIPCDQVPPAGHAFHRKADPKGWLVHQKRRWVAQSAARKKARLAADKAAVMAARRGGPAPAGMHDDC